MLADIYVLKQALFVTECHFFQEEKVFMWAQKNTKMFNVFLFPHG